MGEWERRKVVRERRGEDREEEGREGRRGGEVRQKREMVSWSRRKVKNGYEK